MLGERPTLNDLREKRAAEKKKWMGIKIRVCCQQVSYRIHTYRNADTPKERRSKSCACSGIKRKNETISSKDEWSGLGTFQAWPSQKVVVCCFWMMLGLGKRELPRLSRVGKRRWNRRLMTAIFAGRVTGELPRRPLSGRGAANQRRASGTWMLHWGRAKPRLDGSSGRSGSWGQMPPPLAAPFCANQRAKTRAKPRAKTERGPTDKFPSNVSIESRFRFTRQQQQQQRQTSTVIDCVTFRNLISKSRNLQQLASQD
jgi:hypothetical protein